MEPTRETSTDFDNPSPCSSRLNSSTMRPVGARQFQKKVEEVKNLLRILEQKDKASSALRMQRDDYQASLKNAETLSVKLEHGLMQRDTELRQKQSLLDDMQVHCDEIR